MDFQDLGLEEEGTASHRPFIYSAWQFFSQRWKGSKIYLTEPTLISGLPSWGLWFLYLSSKEENGLRSLLMKRSAKDVVLSINFSWILPLVSLPSAWEVNYRSSLFHGPPNHQENNWHIYMFRKERTGCILYKGKILNTLIKPAREARGPEGPARWER